MTHLGYRCYAKVNLTLEVLRRRDDGYHDLASLVHTISLADGLHMESANTLSSHIEGLDITAESNLVTRAAHVLASTGCGARAWRRRTSPDLRPRSDPTCPSSSTAARRS